MFGFTYSSLMALVISLAICFGVAAIGAKVTVPAIPTWYASLVKPTWTPPRVAFPIVWPLLYFLMAIAAWRLWEAPSSILRTVSVTLFGLQLAFNGIWSPVFFGRHNIVGGLVIILLLAAAIAATMAVSWQVDRLAACLLLPYFAWIVFATALNARIWSLN